MRKITVVFFFGFFLVQMSCLPSKPSRSGNRAIETWGAETNGLQCSLQCSVQNVSEGQAAELILRVHNVGKEARKYHISSCCGPTFKVVATFQDGSVLNFTDLVQQEHHPCGIINWIDLRPAETKEHKLELRVGRFLGQRYMFVGPELGAPLDHYGRLTIRIVLNDIQSNTISIEIVEEKP